MSAERRGLPEWAGRERESDLHWIKENLHLFQIAAKVAFADVGRGAIVVDTTIQPARDVGHPFGYFAQEQIHEYGDTDVIRMVCDYDPTEEIVIVLLKTEKRTSAYRIRLQRRDRSS